MATDDTTSKTVQQGTERPPTPAEQRAARHDGTTDPDTLASDIEKTREELAETLDAIVDRVHPKKVVQRGKEQAKEGVQDAKVVAMETAATAAAVVKEKASTATEAVRQKAAAVKEKRSGGSDATRSPLSPATSVAVGSAGSAGSAGSTSVGTASPGPSPLPSNTISVDVGDVPPGEPASTAGALADAADARSTAVEPVGSDLPAWSPAPAYEPSRVPVLAGAGAAALVALLLLLLRRRRR